MQNALVIPEKGAQFTLATRPIPTPGPREVLVKVRAVALNPVDWWNQKRSYLINEFPAVIGWDIAGEVIALGEGVSRYVVGDKVIGQGLPYPDYGGFQEYALLGEDFSAKVPAITTYEQASTIPSALAAAFVMLYAPVPRGLGLQPVIPSGQGAYANQPILILGGASSVGQYTIQLAKASGFSPIITTASLKHTEKLKALGATHIIDRNIPINTIRPQISEIIGIALGASADTNDGLLSYIFDTVSVQETQTAAYDLLAPGGTLALVLPPLVQSSPEKRVTGSMATPLVPEAREDLKVLYASITTLVENGTIEPSKVEVLPGGLAGIADGVKRLEEYKVSGVKLVAQPSTQ
ncbi:hypothetical protein NP233_g4544 [Leucocoprinus birnbaumii]|uniref:Enoyl reductase (ER) domain-containing protein n=1 Tax=Leucocoprinus birnbaumii TaxID=56174 RepID=A0AAD5VV34_9AGAR|nr:hypothetical protein NP233_g4544 [Leucocoprinus birnbaumii]